MNIFMGITLTTNFALAFEDDYAKALSDLKSGPGVSSACKVSASGVKSCDRPNFFVNGLKVKDIQIQASILNDAFPHFMGLQPDEVLDRPTDDMGLTHGYSLSSGFRIGDRSFLNFNFSRDLYTGHDQRGGYQRRNSDSDEYVRQQKFTEEGTYLLTLKHFVKNETLYINVGLGMHNLNRGQQRDALSTTTQQESWHLSNGYVPVQNNPSRAQGFDPEGRSFMLKAAIGKALNVVLAQGSLGSCTLDTDTQLEVNLVTNEHVSHVNIDSLARLDYVLPFKIFSRDVFGVFAQSRGLLTAHSEGFQAMFEQGAGIDFMETVTVGYRQRFFNGQFVNYQTHNNLSENDNGRIGQFFLSFGYNFK